MIDDDDFSFLDAERHYRPRMGDPREIYTAKMTPWETSSSGRYEARGEIVKAASKFFYSIEKSRLGGEIGGPEWHGPFDNKEVATKAAERAVFAWLEECD